MRDIDRNMRVNGAEIEKLTPCKLLDLTHSKILKALSVVML